MMNVQISINSRTYSGDDVTDNYSTTIPTDIDILIAEDIINAIITEVWGTRPPINAQEQEIRCFTPPNGTTLY